MTAGAQALVPITVTGWRIWDLYAARELHPATLTRGVLLHLDRTGVVMPEEPRQVTASEVDVILDLFGDLPLTFHVSTPADENRVPEFLNKLMARYPGLKERTIQLIPQLRPNTCEALIPLKKKHGIKIVLPHYSLYGADAWAPSVKLADQVLYDSAANRGPQLNLDERAMVQLRVVAEATKAPLSLAGRLTGRVVSDMSLRLHEVRAELARPFALAAELTLRSDGSVDLPKVEEFHDACAKTLGVDVPAPEAAVG